MSTATPELPQELQSLVRQLHGAHIVIDDQYRIVAANDAYRDAFMTAGKEVLGRRCYEVSHGYTVPCDQAGESCPMRRAAESGHYERVLHIHHTPRGEEYVQLHLYPLRDQRGAVTLFVEHMATVQTARAARSQTALNTQRPHNAQDCSLWAAMHSCAKIRMEPWRSNLRI